MGIEAVEEFKRFYGRPIKVYEASITEGRGYVFFLIRELRSLDRRLVILVPPGLRLKPLDGFEAEETGRFGEKSEGGEFRFFVCPCNRKNASELRKWFPYTRPQVIGLSPAVGTGDRLGLATPGHIRAVKGWRVLPVLAQQSIREMVRTSRSPIDVLNDVSWGVFQEGYRGGFAADADHLKSVDDVKATFEAGFTMYTIDPSDHVDDGADSYSLKELKDRFEALPWDDLGCEADGYLEAYVGRRFTLPDLEKGRTIELAFSEETLLRASVKYAAAMAHTARMYRCLKDLFGEKQFDLEVSVDETEVPTTPLEHIFIVSELRRLGVKFQSLALRFVGRFEKAVDYIGDLDEFEETFRVHVLIARAYGPYKLSVHSGSDKFSIYPILGKLAADIIHLKTSGTSYLEALRIVSRHDPELFREIVKYSLSGFEEDRRAYHVSLDVSQIPNPDSVPDDDLERAFLDREEGRQLLHITYGSILTAKNECGEWLFRDRIKRLLIENEEEHYRVVAAHIRRHIEAVWRTEHA